MLNWQLKQEEDNRWTLRLNQIGKGIEIPAILAERMKSALTFKKQGEINCHKAILYLLGRITLEEVDLDFTFGKRVLEISDKEFISVKTVGELKAFVNQNCKGGLLYVGQILDAETGEVAHSFIVGKELNDEQDNPSRFICFDKAGFKFSFGVYEIEKLFEFENYHNQKWRFLPLNDVLISNK